jgi:endonuclease III
MGPKSTALLLWSAFGIRCGLPVDSHVYLAFKRWKWTNALTREECSWQAIHWVPVEEQIRTNDAIGAIRQDMAKRRLYLRRQARLIKDEGFVKKIMLL